MDKKKHYLGDNRLTWYRTYAGDNFWTNRWKALIKKSAYDMAEKGHHKLNPVFEKWLPQEGPIIEAGCGLGQVVLALVRQGRSCSGIDYSKETVEKVKEIRPDMPISFGDATAIDSLDDHYSGYISLGVIEHVEEGAELFISEAHRVLKPEGIAIFTVPYFNPLRKLKAKLNLYENTKPVEDDMVFYQYAFTTGELSNLMEKSGFKVVNTFYASTWNGLFGELHLPQSMKQAPRLGRIRNWVESSNAMGSIFGHMVGLVCKK